MRTLQMGLSIVVFTSVVACGDDKPAESPVMQTTSKPPPASSATAEAPKVEPKSPAELERNTGEAMIAAINAHDAKKIASYFTETAIVKVAGFPDLVGRDAIAADWQIRFDRIADSKSMVSRVFVKGDALVAEWVFTGMAKPMPGGAAGDKPVGAMGVDVAWYTPEGLVKEQHTYMDANTLASQMGMSKQKGRAVPALPSGAPTVVVATGSEMETKNADAAKKMFEAFEKKSDTDFLAGAADDLTWDDLTQPEATKGKAANKKWFTAFTAAFPDVKVTSANVWGIGDFVITEGAITGTQKGAFFGIAPKQKQINIHGLDVILFKDGKVVSGRSYANGMEMATQLGLIPPPQSAKPGDAPKADPAKPDPTFKK